MTASAMDPIREPETGGRNRREHYRVVYPVIDRPRFHAGVVSGVVLDCSESGVRVEVDPLPDDVEITVQERMVAEIRFGRGEEQEVAGLCVRWDGRTLVLHLDSIPIPYRTILREQWKLRQRYPWREAK